MTTTKFAGRLFRFSKAALPVTFLLILAQRSVAQPLIPDHYLHVLMVIDTDSSAGESAKADLHNIKASVLKPIRDLGRHGYLGKVETLDGSDANCTFRENLTLMRLS